MPLSKNTLIGHRGCASTKQENTRSAFEQAIKEGAEWVEMDLRITRDNVVVVFHDAELAGVRIKGEKYDTLLEIAAINQLEFPTLEEILEALEGRVKLLVEIKEEGYEDLVMQQLLQRFASHELMIQSFKDEVIWYIKKHYPAIQAGLLLGTGYNDEYFARKGWRFFGHKLLEFYPWQRLKNCHADFMAVNHRLVSQAMLKRASRENLAVLVWTVNTPSVFQKIQSSGLVSGIITDWPGRWKND